MDSLLHFAVHLVVHMALDRFVLLAPDSLVHIADFVAFEIVVDHDDAYFEMPSVLV